MTEQQEITKLVAPAWLTKAVANGHDMVPDPTDYSLAEIADGLRRDPAKFLKCRRWTCRKCVNTAMLYLGSGVARGSALERECGVTDAAWTWVPSWPGTFAEEEPHFPLAEPSKLQMLLINAWDTARSLQRPATEEEIYKLEGFIRKVLREEGNDVGTS